MARNYALQFDTAKLAALGEDLGGFAASDIGKARVTALNEVAERTDDLARDRITAGINLTDAYLRRRMVLTKATEGNPVAVITASGARDALTVLGRYDARPVIVANKSDAKRKGNAALGIAPGSRQLGVTVQVTRGKTSEVERGFLMPLRRGAEAGGNGFGVFARTRSGKIAHRYGPSVYQLFAYQAGQILDEVSEDLENTMLTAVQDQLTKAISE